MKKDGDFSVKCEICGRLVEKASMREHILRVHKLAEGEDLIAQKAKGRRKSLRKIAMYAAPILTAAIAVAYFLMPGRGPVASYGPELGNKAPLFRLADLAGRHHSLGELLGKKPLMVEFLWTKCPACRSIAPLLNSLYEKWAQKVEFISIAGDPRDSPAMVEQFASAHGNKWPYLMGSIEVMNGYGIEGYPTFFFIDKNGVIKGKILGAPPVDRIQEELRKLAI